MDAGIQQGFVEGGVGHQHGQPPLFGCFAALRVHLHHKQGNVFPGKLFGDLAADAAIAAKDHMVMHGG